MIKANWTALPIVFVAAALVAGETLGFLLSGLAGLWAWALLAVVLLICIHVGWGLPYAIYLIAFMAGVSLAWHSEAERLCVEEYSKTVSHGGGAPIFLLKVEGAAACSVNRKGNRIASFNSYMENVPIKVIAPLPDGKPLPEDGELWRCSGWLALRKNSASRYSRRCLWVTKGSVFEKVEDADSWSAGTLYRRLSGVLALRTAQGLGWSDELAAFGNAMLLGRREGIPYGRLSVFAAAGTVHVFAISGIHVMLIAGMLTGFLKFLGLTARMGSGFAIPMLWAYVMLIGFPASAVRAAVMTSLYLSAHLFGRRPDSLAAWGMAVIVICGVSPKMILNVGCVLSFAVMLGIVLWLRWSAQFASPADCLLKMASAESALGGGWRRTLALWLYRKSSWIFGALGISLAAWIAGAPIAARVFERVSLGSLAIHVAVVPLAGMAVGFAVFGVMMSFVSLHLGVFFNNLSALSIHLMRWISELVVKIPGACIETMPWSWCDCAMWSGAWLMLFALLSRHLPRRERISVKEWENGNDQGAY